MLLYIKIKLINQELLKIRIDKNGMFIIIQIIRIYYPIHEEENNITVFEQTIRYRLIIDIILMIIILSPIIILIMIIKFKFNIQMILTLLRLIIILFLVRYKY